MLIIFCLNEKILSSLGAIPKVASFFFPQNIQKFIAVDTHPGVQNSSAQQCLQTSSNI
jgi:hypothetical protein